MTTATQKRDGSDRSSAKSIHLDMEVLATRLQNYVQEVAEDVRSGNTSINLKCMGETDAIFTLDVILQHLQHKAVNAVTKEKSRQKRRLHSKALFLQTLKNDGGVYSSAEAADILGKTKTTVKNWKDAGRLLALDIDGEFYFPVFQFTDDEYVSEKGILKGVPELLQLLNNFSDRMKYSFFMEERTTVLDGLLPAGRSFTVAEVLKSNPSKEVWNELQRLARVYGTHCAA